MPRVLKDLHITEVSSVDRGAGEGVKVTLIKRDEPLAPEVEAWLKREFTAEQRQASEDKGHAMPGGGFPIENVSDLKNAIQAIGRAKDPAAAKAHIKTRARALGQTDLIPDTWKRDSTMPTPEETKKAEEALNKAIEAAVAKALAGQAAEIAVLKMSDAEKAYCDTEKMTDEQRKAFAAMKPEERAAKMKKSDDGDPVAKALAPVLTENADLKKRLGALEHDKLVADFKKRAVDAGLKEEDGEIMRKAYGGDPEAQKALDGKFKALTKQLSELDKTSRIFDEFGTTKGKDGASAYDQLMAKAQELRKTETKLSEQQAFTKVLTDPANADLAAQHKREETRKRLTVVAA